MIGPSSHLVVKAQIMFWCSRAVSGVYGSCEHQLNGMFQRTNGSLYLVQGGGLPVPALGWDLLSIKERCMGITCAPCDSRPTRQYSIMTCREHGLSVLPVLCLQLMRSRHGPRWPTYITTLSIISLSFGTILTFWILDEDRSSGPTIYSPYSPDSQQRES